MKNSNTSSAPVVLVPKTAFGNGSRTPLSDLFCRAGYDKVNGDFGRNDQVEQGGFTFRAVKGSEAIATQLELFRGKTIGVVMGSDVLVEGDLIAQEKGITSDIRRLLSLNIGPCLMRIIAPDESPILTSDDLSGRSIFTKYPRILKKLLDLLNINDASIRPALGADVRVNEFRAEPEGVAALEIVGSGDTARKANLQIVENEILYPKIGVIDSGNIETNMYLTNIDLITSGAKQAFQELGLALESARDENQFVNFRFNVPEEIVGRFAGFGMKGPTVSDLITEDGSKWKALDVAIPREQSNDFRRELLRIGAKDLLQPASVNVEVSADESEVLSVLPFEVSQEVDYSSDFSMVLGELQETIRQRSQSGDLESLTCRLLEGGVEVYGARLVEEATEVARAARKEGKTRVVEETADLIYMLFVTLRGQEVEFEEVVQELVRRQC